MEPQDSMTETSSRQPPHLLTGGGGSGCSSTPISLPLNAASGLRNSVRYTVASALQFYYSINVPTKMLHYLINSDLHKCSMIMGGMCPKLLSYELFCIGKRQRWSLRWSLQNIVKPRCKTEKHLCAGVSAESPMKPQDSMKTVTNSDWYAVRSHLDNKKL